MLETLFAIASICVLAFAFAFFWGESKEQSGRVDAERESAEEKIDRISRGVEKLMGPRPSRRLLIKHWERRLRRATKRGSDTTLPDSEPRGD